MGSARAAVLNCGPRNGGDEPVEVVRLGLFHDACACGLGGPGRLRPDRDGGQVEAECAEGLGRGGRRENNQIALRGRLGTESVTSSSR